MVKVLACAALCSTLPAKEANPDRLEDNFAEFVVSTEAGIQTNHVVTAKTRQVSLSPLARRALFAVSMTPGAFPSQLAKTCSVTGMDMVDALNELLEAGLVLRTASGTPVAA